MESVNFRHRVLKRLFLSPLVVIPMGMGAASLALGLAMGQPDGYFSFLGLTGVLLGLGAAATRWLVGSGELARQAFEELRAESGRKKKHHLRKLRRRIRYDRDPRTNRLLLQLVRLAKRMGQAGVMNHEDGNDVVAEVRDKAVGLYQSCLGSLERTIDLYEAAQQMATEDARNQLLAQREELLEEVRRSVAHLETTLDHLQSLQLKRDRRGEGLAQMRKELEMGLSVAQRVERRMDNLDRELRQQQLESS